MPRIIINDRNAEAHKRIWADRGCMTGCQPVKELPAYPKAFSDVAPIYPRSEWKGRIRKRRESSNRALIEHYKLPCYDQGGTNFCWSHAGTFILNVATIASGQPMVELAPESVALPLTGGRNRGGTLSEAFEQLRDFGAAERSFIPRNGFQIRDFKDNWKENRKLHRIHESYPVVGPKIWDQVISGLTDSWGFMNGLDWWGHAVGYVDAVWDDDENEAIVEFRNSWGRTYGDNGFAYLAEDRGTPVDYWGIIAVRSVVMATPFGVGD